MYILKQKKFLSALFLLVVFLAVPALAGARGLVPCGGTGENPCNVPDLFALIARVTNFLIFNAGIYAVFQIVFNGFGLVYTMGDEESIATHKKAITEAVVGFVLVMMCFLGINIYINVIVLNNDSKNLQVHFNDPCSYLSANCSKWQTVTPKK